MSASIAAPEQVRDLITELERQHTAAHHQTAHGGAWPLVKECWGECRDMLMAARDNDEKAAVARKYARIFAAFAQVNMHDNREVYAKSLYNADGVQRLALAGEQAVCRLHPALAAWGEERAARIAAIEARQEQTRRAEAASREAAVPQLLIDRLDASGHAMTLDKGRILIAPGALTDEETQVVKTRKPEFVSILTERDRAAEARKKAMEPVIVA